jgi:hypothetical protein
MQITPQRPSPTISRVHALYGMLSHPPTSARHLSKFTFSSQAWPASIARVARLATRTELETVAQQTILARP